MGAFKAQDTARAMGNTLAAGQAVAVVYRDAQPDMPADIDLDRADEGANPALHATGRFRGHLRLGHGSLTASFRVKKAKMGWHKMILLHYPA